MPVINSAANSLISLHFPEGTAQSGNLGVETALAGGQSFDGLFGNLLKAGGESLPSALAGQHPHDGAFSPFQPPWQTPEAGSDHGLPAETILSHSFNTELMAIQPSEISEALSETRPEAAESDTSLVALVSSQVVKGAGEASGNSSNLHGRPPASAVGSVDMVSIAADQNPVASTLRSIDSLEGHGHDLTQTGEGILADVAGEGEMPDSLVRKSSLNSETGLASAPPQVGSASASASTALGFGLSAPTQSIMSPTAESGSYSIDSLHESDTLEKLLDSAKSSDAEELLEFGSDKSLWGQQLGSRIITMVAEDVQQAKIHLDPPELGSLEIQLSLDKSDELRLQIQTQSPQVREVLEAQAHRLRESLSGQGMALAEFDVSDLSQRENHSGQGTDDGRDQGRANESEDSQLSSADLVQEGALAGDHSHTAHQGLVSTFV